MTTITDPDTTAEVPLDDQMGVGPVATSVVRRRWGSSVFGIVAEGHVRRRPSDIVGVVFAVVVIALMASGATDVTRAVHGHTPDFPVVLMAGGAAVLWASRPYLTRPARRLLETAFWLSALAAAALAEGLPGAVIASVVLAWGAAAVAHLCFGSPAATPSAEQVAASLHVLPAADLGLARTVVAPEEGLRVSRAAGANHVKYVMTSSTGSRTMVRVSARSSVEPGTA